MPVKKILGSIGKIAGSGAVNVLTEGPVAGIASTVINTIKDHIPDPAIQAQLEEAQTKAADDLRKAELDYNTQIAKGLIASETGANWYAACWRPTFGYMFTLLIFWNYAIVPLFHVTPVNIDGKLLTAFMAYLTLRTGEKIFGKD